MKASSDGFHKDLEDPRHPEACQGEPPRDARDPHGFPVRTQGSPTMTISRQLLQTHLESLGVPTDESPTFTTLWIELAGPQTNDKSLRALVTSSSTMVLARFRVASARAAFG